MGGVLKKNGEKVKNKSFYKAEKSVDDGKNVFF